MSRGVIYICEHIFGIAVKDTCLVSTNSPFVFSTCVQKLLFDIFSMECFRFEMELHMDILKSVTCQLVHFLLF